MRMAGSPVASRLIQDPTVKANDKERNWASLCYLPLPFASYCHTAAARVNGPKVAKFLESYRLTIDLETSGRMLERWEDHDVIPAPTLDFEHCKRTETSVIEIRLCNEMGDLLSNLWCK